MTFFRAHFLAVALTLAAATFLWLPPLSLFAPALWQFIFHSPQIASEVSLGSTARELFSNTVKLGLLTVFLSLVFGFPVGIICARAPKVWRNFSILLCALPLAIPPILLATTWLEITRTPPARSLAALAATHAATTSPIVRSAFVLALSFFPIVAFAVRSSLLSLPNDVEDAARNFGNARNTWNRVLVPLLSPAIWGALGAIFLLSMWEMGAPDLLDARTYSVEIYRDLAASNALDGSSKDARAALASLPMLALGALALWPVLRALKTATRRGGRNNSSELSPSAAREIRWITPLNVLVLIASPLASMGVMLSLLRPPRVFLEALSDNNIEIGNTIILSTSTALLVTLLAFFVVVSWHNWNRRAQNFAFILLVTPLLIAPIAGGIALLHFWNQPQFDWIYGTAAPTGNRVLDWAQSEIGRFALPIFGYLTRFFPLSILLLRHAATQIDENLLDAARGFGASQSRVLRTIWWPTLAPSLLGNFALMWALSASELSISVLVQQPGGQPLTLPIFQLMHIFAMDKVAALCLILIGLSAIVLAFCGALSTVPSALRRFQFRHRNNP